MGQATELAPGKALYDVVVHAVAIWDRTMAAMEHRDAPGLREQARAAADRRARQAMEHQTRISSIISDASEAMEACVDAGRAEEAREWIDALDEMRRVSDAVGVAVRLANGNSSDPWHPRRLDWTKKAGHDAK